MAESRYAQMIDGAVTRIVTLDLDAVPAHKRDWFRPYVIDRPEHGLLERLTGPERIIEADRVIDRWSTERRSAEEQIGAVKEEAARRIFGRYPAWKQANMTARAVELTRIRVINGSWSDAETVEVAALDGVWAWIKSVRARSDEIEKMSPIPLDFDADVRWPV